MKEIKLNHGKIALISDEDFEIVSNYTWWAEKGRSTWYAKGWIDGKNVKMHRFIMSESDPKIKVDHINHNGLDNQRSNLRLATHSQNNANRKTTKKYLGVYYRKSRGKWFAQCRKNGKNYERGSRKTAEEAALDYNFLAKKLHGEFANLNIITNG